MPYSVKVLRARRSVLRRRRLHRLTRAAVGVLVFALLTSMAYAFIVYLHESPRFQVRNVRVQGANVLREEMILAVAGITRNDNVMRADIETIRQRVESIPSVRCCEVQRVYPDMVIIRIEERVPIAALLVNNRAFEIDEEAVVLRELELSDPLTEPLVTNVPELGVVELGHRLENPALTAALDVWRAFSALALADELTLSEIAAPSPNEIYTYFDEIPFEVRWGRKDFQRQAQHLDVVWREKGSLLPCASYLDLRFDNDVACK